jgi:hypothetical protein
MHLIRCILLTVIITPLIAVVGASAALAAPSATPQGHCRVPPTPSHPEGSRCTLPVVFSPGTEPGIETWAGPAIRPRTIDPYGSAADPTPLGILSHLKWTTWNRRHATGHGKISFNLCKPDCAQGKFLTYKVTVTLRKVAASNWSNNYYVRYFSSMTWAWRRRGHTHHRHYHMNKYGVWEGKVI